MTELTECRTADETALPVTIIVNGDARQLHVDPWRSLADALRIDLGLTGTKIGCNQGGCGACTVLVDGQRKLACLLLAVMVDGKQVTTIEGLADESGCHPMQEAFIAHDALQCGFCTPGQIMSAVGLIAEGVPDDEAAVAEAMSGNLCRCAAYSRIRAAIRHARDEMTPRPGPDRRT